MTGLIIFYKSLKSPDSVTKSKCPPLISIRTSTKKGTPFLRFPVSCCQAYVKANGITCVQSTQRRYLDSCSEQCGYCGHLACLPCSDHSYAYSSRLSHYHDRCYPLKHSGWLASCCFHPYSLHIPLDEPYRSGSCCCSGYRH